MELNEKQKQGLDLCINRYKNKEKYCVIGGYAGSGKSTLIRFIVSALLNLDSNLNEDDITYATFTGKAAQVLIEKGNKNAKTLHKLLYDARPKPDGTFLYMPKTQLEYKIVIVDECSMAPKNMVELLLKHNIFIIFCGDPGQLPPIKKEDDNHLLDKPHIFLDEIMRQAQDSGIIRLSMMIRNEENIDNFTSNDALVINKKDFVTGHLEWADQILCATNETRKNINLQCRELKGYTKPIENNEKLIVCSNYWDMLSDNGLALTNGTIGYLQDIYEQYFYFPNYLKVPNNKIPIISGTFISNFGDNFGTLDCDKNSIITGDATLTPKNKYIVAKNKKFKSLIPYELTYAYCITTWKAQGSEFDKILGIEEGFPYKKDEHKKFLYTMVTRASSKCVIVRS